MKIDYDKLQNNLNKNEALRSEFEDFINNLSAVRYSLKKDENNEYVQPAVFYMWTGYRLVHG